MTQLLIRIIAPPPLKMAYVGHFWSGKHKRVVKGICLICLFYTDPNQVRIPVNYRIYDKSSKKTKNDYFQEMLVEVLQWGLAPAWVTGDSWYASLANLMQVKNDVGCLLFSIESNRLVRTEPTGHGFQVRKLEVPPQGLMVYLKGFGRVKVFNLKFKNGPRYFIVALPSETLFNNLTYQHVISIHREHYQIEQYHRALKQVCHIEHFWVRTPRTVKNHIFCAILAFVKLEFMRYQIEQYHRALKQVCHIEHFWVRTPRTVKNHIFCAILAFVKLEFMRLNGVISDWYGVQKTLFDLWVRQFIQKAITQDNGFVKA